MQSMTASAKEDVHEVSKLTYLLTYFMRLLPARCLVIQARPASASEARSALRAARRRRGRVVRARVSLLVSRLSLSLCLAHGPCRLPAMARPTRPGN